MLFNFFHRNLFLVINRMYSFYGSFYSNINLMLKVFLSTRLPNVFFPPCGNEESKRVLSLLTTKTELGGPVEPLLACVSDSHLTPG